MQIIVMLFCLGIMIRKKESVYTQYRHHNHRPNYIVHISNNTAFFSKVCGLLLVESIDAEPVDTEN